MTKKAIKNEWGKNELSCGQNTTNCSFSDGGSQCGSNPTTIVEKSFFVQHYVQLDVVSTATNRQRKLTVAISVPKGFAPTGGWNLMFHFAFAVWDTACNENWSYEEEFKTGLTPLMGTDNPTYDNMQVMMHSCLANGIAIVHFPAEKYNQRAKYPCYKSGEAAVIDPDHFVEPPPSWSSQCENICSVGHNYGSSTFGQKGGCPVDLLHETLPETCWNRGDNIERYAIDAVIEHLHTNKKKYNIGLEDVSLLGYSGNASFASMCLETFEGMKTKTMNVPYPVPKFSLLIAGGSYQCYFQEQKTRSCHGTVCDTEPKCRNEGRDQYNGCCPDWFTEKKFMKTKHPPTVLVQGKCDWDADSYAAKYYKDAHKSNQDVIYFEQPGEFHGMTEHRLDEITSLVIEYGTKRGTESGSGTWRLVFVLLAAVVTTFFCVSGIIYFRKRATI